MHRLVTWFLAFVLFLAGCSTTEPKEDVDGFRADMETLAGRPLSDDEFEYLLDLARKGVCGETEGDRVAYYYEWAQLHGQGIYPADESVYVRLCPDQRSE